MLDPVDQRTLVDAWLCIGDRALGQITYQLQTLCQSLGPRIGIAGGERFLYIGQGRAVVLIRKRQVGLEGQLGTLISVVWRFYSVQYVRHVACHEELLCQKLWQIVPFLVYIEADFELLWIHSPYVQARDVAHHAHCERRIEMSNCVCICR